MKADSSLVLNQPALSQVYYSIRSLDRQGCGWIRTTIKELQKICGLAKSTINRLLHRLNQQGWLRELKFGKSKSDKGQIFISYTSSKKLVKENNISIIINKQMLKDRSALLERAVLATALIEQQKDLTKLLYKINRGKLPQKNIIEPNKVRIIKRELISKDVRLRSLQKSARRCLDLSLFVEDNSYTVGVSQERLAKKTLRCRQTVAKYLKKTSKLRIFKRVKLSEVFTDPNVFVIADEDTESVKAWKPLPYLYEDKPITHKQYKKLIKKAKALKLSKLQLEVAKLVGITRGYEYSDAGGIQYILDFGIERFKKNTAKVAHMNELPPFQEDRFTPEEYLVAPDEGED